MGTPLTVKSKWCGGSGGKNNGGVGVVVVAGWCGNGELFPCVCGQMGVGKEWNAKMGINQNHSTTKSNGTKKKKGGRLCRFCSTVHCSPPSSFLPPLSCHMVERGEEVGGMPSLGQNERQMYV